MSLLMKALQQAAQNRSGRPPSAPDGSGPPQPGADPAGIPGPDAPADPGADAGVPGPGTRRTTRPAIDAAELSLEPIVERPPATRAAAGSPAVAPSRAGPLAPGLSPAARATGGAASDRRGAPRWSGDLQDDPRAADADATRSAADGARGSERPRRPGQERSDPSPARAGAVLAAGAGAARAGALSRVTRLQWIIIGGSLAGVLLFAYFYIQISYPGLLQRGFRQPVLSSPLAGRAAPPSPAATTSASGALEPGALPAPLPAPAPGGQSQQGSLPMTGVPPVATQPPAAAAAAPSAPAAVPASAAAAAGVPAALAASPLLKPQAGEEPVGPAARPAPVAAPPAAAAVTSTAPSSAPAASAAYTASPAAATGAQRAPAPQSRAPAPSPAGEGIRVTRGSTANPVNPALADAYDHLQAGRIESAQRLYEQVVAADPRNVDALLGMGAVAQLGNQVAVASRLYMRVLEIEPRNAHAQAALIGQLGRADPTAAESQLKTLIAREPSPFLYFTLGNLYADQNRWAQAQQAYFQAHHLQPGNADYAFNLAVGLERIAQPRLAIDYLRTAIRLAEAGARANFDVAAARKRVALLESTNRAP